MHKNKMLAALCMIGLISTMSICATDDVRQPGQPGGGNPPAWSNALFNTVDTVCGFMNGPLEIGMQTVAGWGAKSKLLVTVFLAYFSYSAKDKVIADAKQVSGLIKRAVANRRTVTNKKSIELLERSARAIQIIDCDK